MGNLAYDNGSGGSALADLLPIISLLFSLLTEKPPSEDSALAALLNEPELLRILSARLGLGDLLSKGE